VGGINLIIGNLFVECGRSPPLSPLNKAAITAEQISKNYPSYEHDVQQLLTADPLCEHRKFVFLGFLRNCSSIELFVTNMLGGGSEKYIEEQIEKKSSMDCGCIVIRTAINTPDLRIDVHLGATKHSFKIERLAILENAIKQFPYRSWTISSLVGAPDAVSLLSDVVEMTRRLGDNYRVLFHDYFAICPSYDLIDHSGQYCNIPSEDVCRGCLPILGGLKANTLKEIAPWREMWRDVLGRARAVECFSKSSEELILGTFPNISDKLVIRPHNVSDQVLPIVAPVRSEILQIGILGTILYQKGAEVVRNMAKIASDTGCEIIVIGEVDPRFHHKNIRTSGRYQAREISGLAAMYAVDCWLIPSISPETFCYTAHEALATGLPVFSFDLGAQAEAVRKVWGEAMILPQTEGNPTNILLRIKETMDDIAVGGSRTGSGQLSDA
jgi:glycosyltransferase involved in cell wall biosynthesis